LAPAPRGLGAASGRLRTTRYVTRNGPQKIGDVQAAAQARIDSIFLDRAH